MSKPFKDGKVIDYQRGSTKKGQILRTADQQSTKLAKLAQIPSRNIDVETPSYIQIYPHYIPVDPHFTTIFLAEITFFLWCPMDSYGLLLWIEEILHQLVTIGNYETRQIHVNTGIVTG